MEPDKCPLLKNCQTYTACNCPKLKAMLPLGVKCTEYDSVHETETCIMLVSNLRPRAYPPHERHKPRGWTPTIDWWSIRKQLYWYVWRTRIVYPVLVRIATWSAQCTTLVHRLW